MQKDYVIFNKSFVLICFVFLLYFVLFCFLGGGGNIS